MAVMSRDELRAQLMKRTQESVERKDSGRRFRDIFIEDLPENLSRWKVSEGEHVLDIIPFRAGDFLNRSKVQKNVKKGGVDYYIDLFVHMGIGPMRANTICINQLFDERCAPCEILYQLWAKDKLTVQEEQLLEKVKTKRRCVYLIRCLDNAREMAKGVQLWEVAHWNFQRHVDELCEMPKGGGHIIFSDPNEGLSIAFKRQGTKVDNTQYLGHKFIPREPLPDEILFPYGKDLFPLDTLIHTPTFEEVFQLFFGFDYDGQAITIELALEGDKTSSEPEPEPVQPPPVQRAVESRKPQLVVPPVIEQQAPQFSAPPVEGKECPGGGTFGTDLDALPECGPCQQWDDCADEKDRLSSE